ncbi:MAG: hypothetical protein NVS3B25_31830 [Hymenobacter sp.]
MGYCSWTLRLLADIAVELALVEAILHETVSQVLKKTSYSPTASSTGAWGRGEQPAKAGRPRRESSTYVRQGTACLLAAFEPGTGQRLVEVSARRTGADYCRFMQCLVAHYTGRENRGRAG